MDGMEGMEGGHSNMKRSNNWDNGGHQALADKGIHCQRCKSTLVNSSFCFARVKNITTKNWRTFEVPMLLFLETSL